jgi:trimeric autotransporter adhesin
MTLSSWISSPPVGDLEHGAEVLMTRVIDDKVYMVGKFQRANRKLVNNVAVWDGTSWSGLGRGVDGVAYDICKVGNDIYVCGDFSYAGKSNEEPGVKAGRIARWDGTKWNALSPNAVVDREILTLATDGKSLYVGGNFTKINDETETKSVAKWNGTKLEAIGGKFDRYINSMVWANNKLYVGGYFKDFGDDEISCVAQWDGTTWSEMGSGGLNGTVTRLSSDGKDIYAAGKFQLEGTQGIAKFSGSAWSMVLKTNNETNWVHCKDGKIYFTGSFSKVNGKESYRIGVLDGKNLKTLDDVRNGSHYTLVPFKDQLIIGGKYGDTNGEKIGGVLKWDGSSKIDNLNILMDN